MLLKTKELEIPHDDPFKFDRLSRQDSAESLTTFVESANEPLVICIDAGWGQGKTTFLRMWRQHLVNNEFVTLYFNAWESDFSDDAMVSLLGEIETGIHEVIPGEQKSKAKECFEKAKKIGVGLLKRAIPVATKLVTSGVLDLDNISEQTLSSLCESIVKEQIEKYEASKKTVNTFKEALTEFASNIYDGNNTRKPLVFIIDELDRCRPNFAIEILEKAKHFFNVPNIVFIISADKEQLGHTIRSVYGIGMDTNGYLRRFFDFDYILPVPEKGQFVNGLFNRFGLDEYFNSKQSSETRYEGKEALTAFSELFEIFSLTLREQEHCLALLSMAIRSTPTHQRLFPIFLIYLIVLKVKETELYKKLMNNSISEQELLKILSSRPSSKEFLSTNYGVVLEAYIISCKSRRSHYTEYASEYNTILNYEKASNEEKQRANRILEILKSFDWHGGYGLLGYLADKIEIASRFKSN